MGLVAEGSRSEALRAKIIHHFRGAVRLEVPRRGHALGTGWAEVDAAFPGGGLAPGETAVVTGPPGAGTLALAAGWARVALSEGVPVVVIDGEGTALPHAWVGAPVPRESAQAAKGGAVAPLWVVAPPTPAEAWPAVDIVLRGGGFGLVIALDPGAPPTGAGARLRRLVQERESRLIVVGAAPFTPTARVSLVPRGVEWHVAPTGAEPTRRIVEVHASSRGGRERAVEAVREDLLTNRLRLRARAPDRRPPSKAAPRR
ncbi:MAG: hypothetical protein JRH11_05255 [Deltaproteobacteria bacterium]|nr:hypothetical protein [Deltaproteobacteria bacterium]